MLLPCFPSWCAFVAVRISRLYTYRNRPRVKPVLRLEDRERIEHLVLGARGFVPSKMVHTDHASLYFPRCAASLHACSHRGPSAAVDPAVWHIQDICPVCVAFVLNGETGRRVRRVPKCFETSSRRSLARRFLAAKCFLAWHSVLHRRGTTEWNVTMPLGHFCPATCWSPLEARDFSRQGKTTWKSLASRRLWEMISKQRSDFFYVTQLLSVVTRSTS